MALLLISSSVVSAASIGDERINEARALCDNTDKIVGDGGRINEYYYAAICAILLEILYELRAEHDEGNSMQNNTIPAIYI